MKRNGGSLWVGFLFIVMLLFPFGLPADQESLDLIMEGFEEDTAGWRGGDLETETGADEIMEIYGFAALSSQFFTGRARSYPDGDELKKLAGLEGKLGLNFKAGYSGWEFFARTDFSHDLSCGINGRNNHTDDYISDTEMEFELKEAWIEKSLTPFIDVRAGRQIVAWGTSESFRVVDVVNPMDTRKPGMTDIEDLRLSAAMTRLDLYASAWNLTWLVIHEVRHRMMPVSGSPFYPSDSELAPVDHTGSSLENTQFAAALTGRFEGWDGGVYFANVYHDTPYAGTDSQGQSFRKYPRITMGGATVAMALGTFLFKAEAAWVDGIRFSAMPGKEKSKIDLLAGIEYSGVTDTTLTLEVFNSHIRSFEPMMASAPDYAERDHREYAFRAERDFLNETLNITAVAGISGKHGGNGGFERLEIAYDLSDSISLKLGMVLYQGGNNPYLERIKDNDTVFFNIKWSFQ